MKMAHSYKAGRWMRGQSLRALQHSIGWSSYMLQMHEDLSTPTKKKYPFTKGELEELEAAVDSMTYRYEVMKDCFPEVEVFIIAHICRSRHTNRVLEHLGIVAFNDVLEAGAGLIYLLALTGCIPMPHHLVLLTKEGRELLLPGVRVR